VKQQRHRLEVVAVSSLVPETHKASKESSAKPKTAGQPPYPSSEWSDQAGKAKRQSLLEATT
jgi:hypothetical protein